MKTAVNTHYPGLTAYYVKSKADVKAAVKNASEKGLTSFVIAFHTGITSDVTIDYIYYDVALEYGYYGGYSGTTYGNGICMYNIKK